MLTVSILINGQPLYTRSCYREKWGKYRVDDSSVIEHKYDDGAVVLAQKLLETIKPLEKTDKEKEEEKNWFVVKTVNSIRVFS